MPNIVCQSCSAPCPVDGRFCGHCGEPLRLRCPLCGADHPSTSHYCSGCGSWLGGSTSSLTARQTDSAAEVLAERRTVSLLFCDLVSSVELSSKLDPEDYRSMLVAYRSVCDTEVVAAGGWIAQYVGDGVLAYFGYPTAHEDDAVRAVRAGLKILKSMTDLNERLVRDALPRLSARLAIHTDLVVAGGPQGGLDRGLAVIGGATNVAARLQLVAAPDTLVISVSTFTASEGYFICRPLGPQTLRGLSFPLVAYEVLRPTGAISRLEARPQLTPLIGRLSELELLRCMWTKVMKGHAQIALIRGEAGVGKSRLIHELKVAVADDGPTTIIIQCLAEHQNSALQPVAETLRTQLGLTQSDDADTIRTRLSEFTQTGILHDNEAFFAGLLDILRPAQRIDDDEAPNNPTLPRARRLRSFAAVLDLIELQTSIGPMLISIEDLHWADDSTLSLLALLVERTSDLPIFLALTARPEFKNRYRSALTCIDLQPLRQAETEALVSAIDGGGVLPAPLIRQIIERTEGVPLFVEELTESVLSANSTNDVASRERGATAVPMPTSLQGSLMARLDRLGQAKAVAQLGAAIGRNFDQALVQAASLVPRAVIEQHLERLTEERFLFQLGNYEEQTYSFCHALVQEAAYESMLFSQRRIIHRRIADVLRSRIRDGARIQPELLANHLTRAGETSDAVDAWKQAGRGAAERSANVEALAHFRCAADLLTSLASSDTFAVRMIELQMSLGTQYLVTRGNGAPEVQTAFDKALSLTKGIEETPFAFRALYGLQTFYIVRGQLLVANEIGRRMLDIGVAIREPGMLIQAHRLSGLISLYQGRFDAARAELEHAASLYVEDRDANLRLEYGSDPGTLTLCSLAWALWFRGEQDAAIAADSAAIDLSARLAHPHSRAFALSFSASLYQKCNKPAFALHQADAVVALACANGFPYWEAWGHIVGGWAEVASGHGVSGLARLKQGLDEYDSTGGGLIQPYAMMLLADANLRLGDSEAALHSATRGITESEQRDVHFADAELHRIKGESLYRIDNGLSMAAEDALKTATTTAASQGSPVLEIKALSSLKAVLSPDDSDWHIVNARIDTLYSRHSTGTSTR